MVDDDSGDQPDGETPDDGAAHGGEDRAGSRADQRVGYGKPPKRSQFKKGQCANPKGRGKGVRNLASVVAAAGERRVTIQVDGERREVSAQEAMLLSLIHKGVNGDIRASGQFFKMAKDLGLEAPPSAEAAPVTERDRKIVENFIGRMLAGSKGETDS